MRKVLLLSTALTLGALNPGFAGGPVVIKEDVVVVEAKPASSTGMLIPLLLIAAIVLVVSGDDDDPLPQPSDIRLKEDIQRVGTNHLGLGVYRYRYKGLDGVYEGVMAQEVEVMHPSAIRALPYGYKAVDYAKLGLEMRRVA
jgi:hypothetical protein